MEKEIKTMKSDMYALKIRMNILMIIGAISLIFTIVKFFLSLNIDNIPTPSTNTNSVQISGADKVNPQREYLSTDEVAEREGVSARTITSWIEQCRISPMPIKSDRAWIIAVDYRILPQVAVTTKNN